MTESEHEIVKRAAVGLAEHFDTVQIFVSKHNSDGTHSFHWGAGNWFGRYGQVRDWLSRGDEESRVEQRIQQTGGEDGSLFE